MLRRYFLTFLRGSVFNKTRVRRMGVLSSQNQIILTNDRLDHPHPLGTMKLLNRTLTTDPKVDSGVSSHTSEDSQKDSPVEKARLQTSHISVEEENILKMNESDISSNIGMKVEETRPLDTNIEKQTGNIEEKNSLNLNVQTVFMRGLPYSITTEEIIKFFDSVDIKPTNIILKYDRYGFTNGKAEVEFETHDDALKALKKQNHYIGNRYIELSLDPFPQMSSARMGMFSNRREFGSAGLDVGRNFSEHFTVKLSGLPYSSTEEDIRRFFEPLNLSPIEINMKHTNDGYPLGICFVKFQSMNEALEALKNNNKYIGDRYIKITLLRSSRGRMPGMNDDQGNFSDMYQGIASPER